MTHYPFGTLTEDPGCFAGEQPFCVHCHEPLTDANTKHYSNARLIFRWSLNTTCDQCDDMRRDAEEQWS